MDAKLTDDLIAQLSDSCSASADGDVTLRIEIDEEHRAIALRERMRQAETSGGLADAVSPQFLVAHLGMVASPTRPLSAGEGRVRARHRAAKHVGWHPHLSSSPTRNRRAGEASFHSFHQHHATKTDSLPDAAFFACTPRWLVCNTGYLG